MTRKLTESMTTEELRRATGTEPLVKQGKKPARHGRGVRPDNDVMNKTEAEYSRYLEELKVAGAIYDWKFHAFTLTIADPPNAKSARWTPDFAVWTCDMVLEFHEIKGFMEDHALVRIKIAAAQFPHPVYVIKKVAKKFGGNWEIKQF